MKRGALLLVVLLASCGQSNSDGIPSETDAAAGESGAANAGDSGAGGEGGAIPAAAPLVLPASCASDKNVPPNSLVCTALYADIEAKQIAPGIEAYAPAVALWADGAEKQRFISLPAGTVIDNSNPDEWSFPVGTKVWKEFSVAGQRIETRLWQKADTHYWVNATYAWNSDESAATRSKGGDIALPTRTYHIPTSDECGQCHHGRTDRILGFEQVLLGLKGATGLTLDRLSAAHQLSNPPPAQPLVIGDDGTGVAAPALAWLHVNCGTTCHNRNSSSTAWSTGMFLRLPAEGLDGRSVNGFDSLTTTLGLKAVAASWKGQTRIAPGDLAHSLLYQLISHRGTGEQMPPIASNLVDDADIALVAAWIAAMPPAPGGSGGNTSAGSGGTSAGSGGTSAGNGGTSAGSGGTSAGSGGTSAGNGGTSAGSGGTSGLEQVGGSAASGGAGNSGADGVGGSGAASGGAATGGGGETAAGAPNQAGAGDSGPADAGVTDGAVPSP